MQALLYTTTATNIFLFIQCLVIQYQHIKKVVDGQAFSENSHFFLARASEISGISTFTLSSSGGMWKCSKGV